MKDHFEKIIAHLGELDAILLTSEANTFYASGFAGEGMVLATKNGCHYLTDSRYTEAAEKAVRGASVVEIGREKPFSAAINEVLSADGVKCLGFEDAAMTVAEYRTFTEKLRAELYGASELLSELRAQKDAEELEALIAAQRIAERAWKTLLGEIRAGVTEKEIAARLQYLMLSYGAEKMSFDPIVASGANGSMPHAVPTEKEIQAGEFVTLDFGCVCRGYCSDMTRTVCIGVPTREMREVYDTVLRAQSAGIAAARAGVTGKEIDGAARELIENAGYGAYFGHSFGHGVGVEIHESPNASPANGKSMPTNAVISAEPGIYLPGRFGVRIEDVLVLRDGGCEDITRAGKDLLIL